MLKTLNQNSIVHLTPSSENTKLNQIQNCLLLLLNYFTCRLIISYTIRIAADPFYCGQEYWSSIRHATKTVLF